MRRIRSVLVVLLLGIGIAVVSTSPAHAFGGESLKCKIPPNVTYSQHCLTTYTYGAGPYFKIFGESGTYTRTWTITGTYENIATGCGSADNYCSVVVNRHWDADVQAIVKITQNGQSANLTADAFLPAVCGGQLC